MRMVNNQSTSLKKLLHIIPYSDFIPPRNGGAMRCYHLAVELSRNFDLTILTLQPKDNIPPDEFRNVRIINPVGKVKFRGLINRIRNAVEYRLRMRSLTGPAEATVLQFYPVLQKLLKQEHFDVVLSEHLHSMLLGELIRRVSSSTLHMVDQHNIDHLLYEQNHSLTTQKEVKEYKRLKELESHLDRYADFFITCSSQDRDRFENLNNHRIKGFVVPNGTVQKSIDISKKDYSSKRLIFCGSLDYSPNRNGLLWFYNNVWPELKKNIQGIILTVIGRNGTDRAYWPLKEDPQVDFVGEVDNVEPYYWNTNIAIIPLFEGSGTRLKILEAMSFGNPVVSTSIGAEGIEYTDCYDIYIADNKDYFKEIIKNALDNPDKLKIISNNAQILIKNRYAWEVIGNTILQKINNQIMTIDTKMNLHRIHEE